jgi:lipoprotein-releasing system ATP-binding protein
MNETHMASFSSGFSADFSRQHIKTLLASGHEIAAILSLQQISRSYSQAGAKLTVLSGVNLTLKAGEIVALVGPSGAGKSTLLHIAGLLDRAEGGDLSLCGQEVSKLSERERTRLRAHDIGFVYQFHHLLPEFSALENVVMPQLIIGCGEKMARERALELLTLVGLGHRAAHRPAALSGGEQQRVALARALANRPKLLLADEPTGNLDPDTAREVFALLLSLVRGQGLAALIATHNLELARLMDRRVELRAGTLTAL